MGKSSKSSTSIYIINGWIFQPWSDSGYGGAHFRLPCWTQPPILAGSDTVRLKLDIPISIWLVVSTLLKNMKVSWDYYSQSMEK